MRFKTMAFAAAVSIALPAIAQTADPAAPAPKPKKERKTCRALPGMTGSNMAKMVCHTKDEWVLIDENGLDPTANIGSRSTRDGGNLGPGVR